MAIPNIVSVSSIYGTTTVAVLTTTLTTTIITAASDKVSSERVAPAEKVAAPVTPKVVLTVVAPVTAKVDPSKVKFASP